MNLAFKISKHWLRTNGCGIFAYLLLLLALIPTSDTNPPNTFGTIQAWLFIGLPIVIGFLVFNTIWLASILKRDAAAKKTPLLLIWLATCLAWGGAMFIGGIGIGMLKILIIMIDKNAWR